MKIILSVGFIKVTLKINYQSWFISVYLSIFLLTRYLVLSLFVYHVSLSKKLNILWTFRLPSFFSFYQPFFYHVYLIKFFLHFYHHFHYHVSLTIFLLPRLFNQVNILPTFILPLLFIKFTNHLINVSCRSCWLSARSLRSEPSTASRWATSLHSSGTWLTWRPTTWTTQRTCRSPPRCTSCSDSTCSDFSPKTDWYKYQIHSLC